jgi:hypothetical protein
MGRNQTSFKNGEVHNPKGRPKKGQTLTEQIEKALLEKDGKFTRKEILADIIVSKAMQGDFAFAKLVISYTDGMPMQRQMLIGDFEAPPIQVLFSRYEGRADAKDAKGIEQRSNSAGDSVSKGEAVQAAGRPAEIEPTSFGNLLGRISARNEEEGDD